MEGSRYTGFLEPPRKRCCRQGLQLVLLGMLTAALWAGLLTLLLLWHWDTVRNLRQLEDSAAQNVSQVSKVLHRYQSDQMAQKSQAAQLSQDVQELQVQQKQMEAQDSELSWDLDRLREDLSDSKSQSLNERRAASDSLDKLQEEVAKLWMEILVSKGEGVSGGGTVTCGVLETHVSARVGASACLGHRVLGDTRCVRGRVCCRRVQAMAEAGQLKDTEMPFLVQPIQGAPKPSSCSGSNQLGFPVPLSSPPRGLAGVWGVDISRTHSAAAPQWTDPPRERGLS